MHVGVRVQVQVWMGARVAVYVCVPLCMSSHASACITVCVFHAVVLASVSVCCARVRLPAFELVSACTCAWVEKLRVTECAPAQVTIPM